MENSTMNTRPVPAGSHRERERADQRPADAGGLASWIWLSISYATDASKYQIDGGIRGYGGG